MRLFKMAWRNIWRGRRRTLVTISATAFGLLMMVLYSSLVEGYLSGTERNILELELGDVQIRTPAYQDDPSIYEHINAPGALLEALQAKGFAAAATLLGGGLAASGDASAGASLRGVNVQAHAKVSTIHRHVWQGAWLSPDEPGGVVVGRRLARTLSLKVGDELVLLSQSYDGSIANGLFTVRGILKGISDGTDRAAVFITESAFRGFFAMPEAAHEIVVRRPPGSDLAAVTAQVRAIAPGLEVRNWRELMPTIATMLDSTRALMTYIFLIVYVAVGILVLNATLMAVFERIREFGVLKALGVGPFEVFFLIVIESGFQVVLAVGVGLALSVPALWYLTTVGINLSGDDMHMMGLAFDPVWRSRPSAGTVLAPLLTLLVIVGLAVIYPATKAALLRPVDALHHR